jgi:hypothetical protein
MVEALVSRQRQGEPLVLVVGLVCCISVRSCLGPLAKEFQVIDWNYRGAGESDRVWVEVSLDRWVDV